jgi:hypothetical protein
VISKEPTVTICISCLPHRRGPELVGGKRRRGRTRVIWSINPVEWDATTTGVDRDFKAAAAPTEHHGETCSHY